MMMSNFKQIAAAVIATVLLALQAHAQDPRTDRGCSSSAAAPVTR